MKSSQVPSILFLIYFSYNLLLLRGTTWNAETVMCKQKQDLPVQVPPAMVFTEGTWKKLCEGEKKQEENFKERMKEVKN
jgi:hypothetical protein